MSKFKFINIVDSIFITFSIFLICFAWLEFYIRDIWIALLLAVFVAFCLIFLLKYFKDKKLAKRLATIEKHNKTESYINNFQLYSDTKKLAIIKNFIKDKEVKTVAKHLEYYSGKIKNIVHISLSCEKFSKNMLLDLIKTYKNKCDRLIVITHTISTDCESFAKTITNLEVCLLNKFDFYNLCVQNKIEIEEQLQLKTEKLNIKNIFKNFLSPSHFKGFFISGCLLIFTSFIFRFTNYYLIFGTILLIISLLCKLPKFKTVKKDVFD